MGSRAGDLLAHIVDGRGSFGGPNTGGYVCFDLSINTVAASQTDLEVAAVALPFDMRIEEISASCTTSTGGASRGLFQITDGTNDLLTADTLLVSAGSARVAASAMVAAQRTRAQGDRLQLDITTVASEVITALTVTITGYVRHHVNASDDDD